MRNKQTIIIGGVFVVAFTISLAVWLFTPGWVALLPGQNSEGMKAGVMSHLVQSGARYKVDSSTGEILVRSDEVAGIREKLTAEGLPIQDQLGFELFDETEYGMSEFMQNMNYQRALEVELARTIRALHGIKSARVHLTLEKESLFRERQKTAKASVVIEPSDTATLAPAKIVGIKEIVATSVAGLNSDAVSVIDIYGKPISSDSGDYVGGGDRARLIEAELQSKIYSLLEGIFPHSDIRIGVNVELDLNKKVSIEENIVPKNGAGEGYVVKSRKVSASEKGLEKDTHSTPRDSSTEEIEYSYSLEKVETEHSPGMIKRIGVGVVIVGEPLGDEWVAKVESLIGTTIGVDESRGDAVKVLSVSGNAEVADLPYRNVAKEGQSDDQVDSAEPEVVTKDSTDHSQTGDRLGIMQSYLRLDTAIVIILILAALVVLQFTVFVVRYLKSRKRTALPLSKEDEQRVIREFRTWMEK